MVFSLNRCIGILLIVLSFSNPALAQRLNHTNQVSWYNGFATVNFTPKLSLWLEYQWRRDGFIETWHQSLARTGVQYQLGKGVSAMLGYAYVISYPFGDYPAGPYTIPEHRIFQQLAWNDNIGRLALNHRFRLEQRFMGRIDQKATEYTLLEWLYANRFRYQLRATLPLNNKTLTNKTWYLAAYDEIFIGFGKNVNQNIFDQNRIGGLVGYQFNKLLRVDAGFFNQTVQQGGLVNNREVFQYNNGLLINCYFTVN